MTQRRDPDRRQYGTGFLSYRGPRRRIVSGERRRGPVERRSTPVGDTSVGIRRGGFYDPFLGTSAYGNNRRPSASGRRKGDYARYRAWADAARAALSTLHDRRKNDVDRRVTYLSYRDPRNAGNRASFGRRAGDEDRAKALRAGYNTAQAAERKANEHLTLKHDDRPAPLPIVNPVPVSREDIDRRFDAHVVGTAELGAVNLSRGYFKALANRLRSLPEGREKALAFTHLEEASFWANAAVARNAKS